MQGHGQLLGQGAGQDHREPGAGEAPRPRGHHQPADLGPARGGQQLLQAGQQGARELAAQGEGQHLGGLGSSQGLQAHGQAVAGTVQGHQ